MRPPYAFFIKHFGPIRMADRFWYREIHSDFASVGRFDEEIRIPGAGAGVQSAV